MRLRFHPLAEVRRNHAPNGLVRAPSTRERLTDEEVARIRATTADVAGESGYPSGELGLGPPDGPTSGNGSR